MNFSTDLRTFLDQIMTMTCRACANPFTTISPAPCPVEDFVAFSQNLQCPRCGSHDILLGQYRTAAEDARYPHGKSANASVSERLFYWAINGDTGSSSRAIAAKLGRASELAHGNGKAHPIDTADLRRCLLLLRRIPEFHRGIDGMSGVSPTWARIVARFDELVALFEEETGIGLERAPTPHTSALLATLIAEPQG